MANFDQRNQHVVNQVNAERVDVINFGTVQNTSELVNELRNLLLEISKANQAGKIKEDISVDIESNIRKAIIEIEKPQPKKNQILEHLEGAKKLLEGLTSATSFVSALMQAIKIVGGLFL